MNLSEFDGIISDILDDSKREIGIISLKEKLKELIDYRDTNTKALEEANNTILDLKDTNMKLFLRVSEQDRGEATNKPDDVTIEDVVDSIKESVGGK